MFDRKFRTIVALALNRIESVAKAVISDSKTQNSKTKNSVDNSTSAEANKSGLFGSSSSSPDGIVRTTQATLKKTVNAIDKIFVVVTDLVKSETILSILTEKISAANKAMTDRIFQGACSKNKKTEKHRPDRRKPQLFLSLSNRILSFIS